MTVFLYLTLLISLAAGIAARLTPRYARLHAAVRLGLTAWGILALCLSPLLFARDVAALTGDSAAWAQDAFTLWLRVAGGGAAGIAGVLLLCALTRHRWVRARALAAAAASVLLSILAHAYAVICQTALLPLADRVVLFSLGCVLLLGLGECADRFFTIGKQKKKKL